MSRKKCCNRCKCKPKKHHCCDCGCNHGKCDTSKNCGNSCSGFNACTALPTLLILCQSGLLNNDRAYTLLLLFWLCGGNNANSCGYNYC